MLSPHGVLELRRLADNCPRRKVRYLLNFYESERHRSIERWQVSLTRTLSRWERAQRAGA